MSHAAITFPIPDLEQFLTNMSDWAWHRVSLSVRRGDAIASREDLMQEARLTLIEIHQKYAGHIPEPDLRRLGTRAIFYDLNKRVFEKAMTAKRGKGLGPRSLSDEAVLRRREYYGITSEKAPTILDRLVFREAIEAIGDESEAHAKVLRDTIENQEYRAPVRPTRKQRRTSRKVYRRVCAALHRDGYIG